MGGKVRYLIGLDLGTSAVKGVLLREDGLLAATARTPRHYNTPGGGQVEFDAEALYGTVADTVRALASRLPDGGEIEGLAMASASGNTVLADAQGSPLAPVISWLDGRVTDEMERVLGLLDAEDVRSVTGWPKFNGFPLAHLSWFRCHRPELLDGAAFVCMSTEYVIHRMTGVWTTDPSTATPFYLQDQVGGGWCGPLLEKLGIPRTKLPTIRPSGTAAGGLLLAEVQRMGLPARIPVVLGSFDHPAAARGAGVLRPGQMLLSCGTSWVGFYPVEDRGAALRAGLLVDPFLSPAGPWGAMFSLPAVAQRLEAYVDEYAGTGPEKFSRFTSLAACAAPGAGGLSLDPTAELRLGLLENHTRAEVCRALMEGMALFVRRRMEELSGLGIRACSVTMVGGPSEDPMWPQVMADALGCEVAVVCGQCAGAAGAALLAGIGAGVWRDEEDAFARCGFGRKVFTPV